MPNALLTHYSRQRMSAVANGRSAREVFRNLFQDPDDQVYSYKAPWDHTVTAVVICHRNQWWALTANFSEIGHRSLSVIPFYERASLFGKAFAHPLAGPFSDQMSLLTDLLKFANPNGVKNKDNTLWGNLVEWNDRIATYVAFQSFPKEDRAGVEMLLALSGTESAARFMEVYRLIRNWPKRAVAEDLLFQALVEASGALPDRAKKTLYARRPDRFLFDHEQDDWPTAATAWAQEFASNEQKLIADRLRANRMRNPRVR